MTEGDGSAKVFTQEEVDAMVAEANKSLEANRNTILEEAKRAKEALASFEGVDPKEYKRLKDAAAEAERQKAEADAPCGCRIDESHFCGQGRPRPTSPARSAVCTDAGNRRRLRGFRGRRKGHPTR